MADVASAGAPSLFLGLPSLVLSLSPFLVLSLSLVLSLALSLAHALSLPPSRVLSLPLSHVCPRFGAVLEQRMGTSLIRKRLLLGPYSRPVPRALWWSWGGGAFL